MNVERLTLFLRVMVEAVKLIMLLQLARAECLESRECLSISSYEGVGAWFSLATPLNQTNSVKVIGG